MKLRHAKQSSAIRVRGSSDEALGFETAFSGGGIGPEQVQRKMLDDGHVVSGMVGSGAHLVISENDIHAPVQVVLDGPMLTNGYGDSISMSRQAAQIETLFGAGLSLYPAFGFDDSKRGQPRPLFAAVQARQGIKRIAAACLDTPVILLHRLRRRVRGAMWRLLEQHEEVPDRISQRRLIVLNR